MAKDNLVKVVADYPYTFDSMVLWGVLFEFVNGAYVATLNKQEADEMLKYKRVKLV